MMYINTSLKVSFVIPIVRLIQFFYEIILLIIIGRR